MWEDLTVFYGKELIVGDLSDLWEGFNKIFKREPVIPVVPALEKLA